MSGSFQPFLTLWRLELVGRPAGPGGRDPSPGAGEVAFVRREGRELVLKLLPAGGDEARMGEALAHWGGRGAVRLEEAAAGAVLMERALPGVDLVGLIAAGRDDEATLILCDVMKQLSRPAPTTGAFRRVEDWGQAFRRNFTAAIAAGIEAALIRRAETMFFRLCDTQATRILLHGDLHHDNVVRDDRRGWLAIDPKGVLGEPAYETGAALRNPIENGKLCADAQTIDRRARLMSEQLGYPFERIIGWCFAQWLLAVLWAVEDGLAFSPDWLEGPRAAAGLIA